MPGERLLLPGSMARAGKGRFLWPMASGTLIGWWHSSLWSHNGVAEEIGALGRGAYFGFSLLEL